MTSRIHDAGRCVLTVMGDTMSEATAVVDQTGGQANGRGGAGLLTLLRVAWQRHRQERACAWTRAQLERHQQRRLAALRTYVAARSPFYRRFHSGLQQRPLHELPILSKQTLMENFDELVTDRSLHLAELERYLHGSSAELFHDRYVVLATSGSTGRRGVFVFDPTEWIAAIAAISRPIAWSSAPRSLGSSEKRRERAEIAAEQRTRPRGTASTAGREIGPRSSFSKLPLRHPPRSALIASATPWHYSARIGKSLSTRLLPTLRLDAAAPLATLVAELNAWQPDALATYPSVLQQLADEQLAGRLQIALMRIATSAEVLTAETRRRAEQAWGARVFETYGATEYAPIAAECIYGNKHLFEDSAIIEIVDERGRAVPPGERGARILLTVLERRTQPLIRYEISDLVRELPGTCPCGRPYRMVASIEGRSEDVLYFPPRDGGAPLVALHPTRVHEVLETLPGSGWQLVHDEHGLTLSLLAPVDAALAADVRARLTQLLQAVGAAVPAIEVRSVEELQRGVTGKAPLIIARLSARRPDEMAI
jgi:phenylacetate-coenzyme A ligase PaaK-like adenylate-forming protein